MYPSPFPLEPDPSLASRLFGFRREDRNKPPPIPEAVISLYRTTVFDDDDDDDDPAAFPGVYKTDEEAMADMASMADLVVRTLGTGDLRIREEGGDWVGWARRCLVGSGAVGWAGLGLALSRRREGEKGRGWGVVRVRGVATGMVATGLFWNEVSPLAVSLTLRSSASE